MTFTCMGVPPRCVYLVSTPLRLSQLYAKMPPTNYQSMIYSPAVQFSWGRQVCGDGNWNHSGFDLIVCAGRRRAVVHEAWFSASIGGIAHAVSGHDGGRVAVQPAARLVW